MYEINDLSDKVFETAIVHSMIFAFCKEQLSDYMIRVSTSDNLGSINVLIPSTILVISLNVHSQSELTDQMT